MTFYSCITSTFKKLIKNLDLFFHIYHNMTHTPHTCILRVVEGEAAMAQSLKTKE